MEILIALQIALILAVVAYMVFAGMYKNQYKIVEELKSKGRYEEALKRLLKMFQKSRDDIRVIYELGEVNRLLKNNLEAIGYYLKLLEKDVFPPVTTKGDVLKNVGLLFLEEKKIREAFYYLYYASYFLPADKDVNYYLFRILFSEENFRLAETFGQRVLPFYSKEADFLTDFALTKLELGKYGDAIELLEKALHSKSFKTRVILAFTLLKLGGYKRAIDLVSILKTEEGIPDAVMCIVYKIIIYSNLYLKGFNEAINYWDQFLTFAVSKNLERVIKEIGFGIFMTYLYFSRYEDAKAMLSTLREYEISEAVINSVSPFIDGAIESVRLKKEMKSYDLKPIREIENYVNSWLNSSLRVEEIREAFYPKKKEGERLNVPEIIKEVQSQLELHVSKVDGILKTAGQGLSVEEEEDVCNMFVERLDSQTFLTICDELVKALGFNINQKLLTEVFVESEGVDYICTRHKEPEKYYVAIRRWGTNEIGKIAVVDINQKSIENNCDKVLIISSAPLTEEARDFVEKNSRIEFKTCKEVAGILKAIIPSI
ncbi:MAG: restriction endonuclease [Brevinematia bacterium]